MSKLSRRDFFKVASVGAAGIAISNPFQAFAATTKKVAPSDTVRVVGIGCGPQGRTVHGGFNSLDDCQVVAVCDVHDRKSAAAAERFTAAKGKPVPTYHDFFWMTRSSSSMQLLSQLQTTGTASSVLLAARQVRISMLRSHSHSPYTRVSSYRRQFASTHV